MKIKVHKDGFIEIETHHVPAFCLKCGLLIGSAEIVKGSESLNWMLMNPLCYKCFSELGIKVVQPKIVN